MLFRVWKAPGEMLIEAASEEEAIAAYQEAEDNDEEAGLYFAEENAR